MDVEGYLAWVELDLNYTSNFLYSYAMLTFKTGCTICSHVHSHLSNTLISFLFLFAETLFFCQKPVQWKSHSTSQKWVHIPLHHPERQLLWHPPVKTCCHCQSEGEKQWLFSPLSGSMVQGSWDAVRLPSLPALLASETAWCSRAPGKYSGCWPQTSEPNASFHAFEVNQATNSPELCVPPEYLPPGSKQPSPSPVAQKRACELQIFTPLMHCWPGSAVGNPGTALEASVRRLETSLPNWKGKVIAETPPGSSAGNRHSIYASTRAVLLIVMGPRELQDLCIAAL